MNITLILLATNLFLSLLGLCYALYRQHIQQEKSIRIETLIQHIQKDQERSQQQFNELIHSWQQSSQELREAILQRLLTNLQSQQESFYRSIQDFREQITLNLQTQATHLSQSIDKLTHQTEQRLQVMGEQVEKRLFEGFEKTTATFSDVVKRLALIDEAQKKIAELSTNVVSLQEVLADKKSRGAFGEVQLSALIHNIIPENHFSLQHTLTNGKRVDCLLFLPEPTGNIAIDAKFPLESYRKIIDTKISDNERLAAEQVFRQDIRKHIQDISTKYIIPGETSDGAVMFIPAEAIFAEIHSRFPDLIDAAQKARVWLVSPTTLMAVLTTARAVLKDAATRQQIHLIQDHLRHLAKDFMRFEQRMGNLARHIDQAQQDVKDVQISAEKITQRFTKIEKVEINQIDAQTTE